MQFVLSKLMFEGTVGGLKVHGSVFLLFLVFSNACRPVIQCSWYYGYTLMLKYIFVLPGRGTSVVPVVGL